MQQLVYTVTAAAAMAGLAEGPLPVQILVDGREPATPWLADIPMPVERVDPLGEVPGRKCQINDPAEGAVSLSSPLIDDRRGGKVFEANVLWQVWLRRRGGRAGGTYHCRGVLQPVRPVLVRGRARTGRPTCWSSPKTTPQTARVPGPTSDSRSFSIE